MIDYDITPKAADLLRSINFLARHKALIAKYNCPPEERLESPNPKRVLKILAKIGYPNASYDHSK